MATEKNKYFDLLATRTFTHATLDQIFNQIKAVGLQFQYIPTTLTKKNQYGEKITDLLTRLTLYVVVGNSSWEGLVVGFPGDQYQLSTKSIGTQNLRKILYPMLDLHHRLQSELGKDLPCIYIVGERFSDVFLRKIDLLRNVVPHIIVLTGDLYKCSTNKSAPITTDHNDSESWTQMKLCQMMDTKDGIVIPGKGKDINAKFLSYELLCAEGNENPERLDILGYDKSDHALIAFEIKGPRAGRVDLENLFLQGIEHRNWLEKNKMAVKLLFDRGPRGRRINTKKRVRLLLGFYGNQVPHLFKELRYEAVRRDPYLEIAFIQLSHDGKDVFVNRFDDE